VKADGGDFVEITRATAGDMTDAAELFVDQGGNFAELGADALRVVQIFADGDFRARHG